MKVKILSYQCFRKTPNLCTAFIPNTIIEMNADTFKQCTKLHTVIFEENSNLISMKHVEFYDTALQTITFPIKLKQISYQMFYNCISLKSIIIPNFLSSDDANMLSGAPNDLKILVPMNYPYDKFGNRNVVKVLEN